MSALNFVAIATLLGGALWTLPALIRRRLRDPMRLHLCLALLLMGAGNVLAQPSVLNVVDGVTFEGFSKVTYNVEVLVGLSLMVGFLRESPLRRWAPPWPWEVGACLVCLAGMLAVTAFLPAQLRNHVLTSAYLGDWRVRTFYNFGNFYLLFGYAASAYLAGRHARRGRSLRRLSFNIIAVGLTGLALTCIFRFLWVNLPSLRGDERLIDYADVFLFGQVAAIVVCVGLSLPFFVSVVQIVREMLDHCRQYRGLEELWCQLARAYPELILDQRSRRRRVFLASSRAVYRRYVECRDGLIRLGPYLRLASQEMSTPEPQEDLRASADLIVRALRLQGDQGPRDGGPPTEAVFVLAPRCPSSMDGHDYEEDLGTLVRLSRELCAMRTYASV
ncbi:MAB_1171c family putative transporter [Streptomyces sp. NRRL S-1022]|uniref:MAB_1171c family putative transporter n=1 Tax=Streptomyces sp. NRRL S-1022 TaxID=1463880 RepID=UPI000566739E|nr:MAB_1171c family putative transporter [Streptomyces sp. NRRL S-1022]